jgi:hypothetical protein
METPKLSEHARRRCVEMDVVTKRVKRLVANPDIIYRGSDYGLNTFIAMSAADPEIAAVFAEATPRVIVTVLWRTPEEYTR